MWPFIERAKKIIFAALLSIIPLVLLYLQNNDYQIRAVLGWPVIQLAGVLQKASLNITSVISDSIFKHIAVSSKYNELMTLRAKVQQINSLEARIDFLQSELNSIINLSTVANHTSVDKKIYAKIIAKSGTPMARLIRLNKGILDGVKVKDPVISDVGVVGQVLSVADNFADVLLISDASSSLDVKILGSNARGLIRGITSNTEYLMQIRDIDALFNLRKNDVIVSSGVNSGFPAGIPVGKIKEVVTSKDGLWHSAKISPFVSIDTIEHVMILSEDPFSKNTTRASAHSWPLAER
jgi:rod shape-determining protein MreC